MQEHIQPTPPATVDSISATTSAPASSPHDSNAPTTINAPGIQDAAENMRTAQGKSKRKSKTSAKVQDAYKARTYDRMELQLIKGDKSRLQAAAARLDISPTALIIRAVNAYTAAETLTEKAKNPYI